MDLTKPNYQAWLINEKDYPKQGTIEEKIWFIVGYGILAPSTHNTQPWQFEVNGNTLTIMANPALKLPEADPSGRHIFISLGALTFNVLTAASYFNFETKVSLRGESKNEAKIDVSFNSTKKPDQKLRNLFPQITRRYSEKRIIRSLPLSNKELEILKSVSVKSASSYLTDDRASIKELSKLCFKTAASYADRPMFAKELSGWLRSNKTNQTDGMPGFSNGLSNPKALVGKTLMKKQPKALKVMAKKYLKMLEASPAVGIIASSMDEWRDWVNAGVAYEELSLTAAKQQISLSPIAAPIERPERKQLSKYFLQSSKYPQLFFRLVKPTTGIDPLHSPRQQLSRQNAERALVSHLQKEGIDVIQKKIEVKGKILNYITAGQGRPLLLVHGANFGWGQWLPNIKDLAKKHKVIALDLLGCGSSEAVNFRKVSVEDYVLSVEEFIKKLHLPSVNIVGHSFGGAIAAQLAQKDYLKVEKLVLVNPMGFVRKVPGKQKLITLYPFARLLSKTAIKPTRSNMQKFLGEPLINKDAISPILVDYYWTAVESNRFNHPILFMHSLTNPFLIKPELNLLKVFKEIKQPTLVIIGDKDYLTPLAAVKKNIKLFPRAKLKIFHNTGHVPSLEKSKRFNSEVIAFLE